MVAIPQRKVALQHCPVGSIHSSHPELPELEQILRGSSPIESTEACGTFELTWKRYVAYPVTEECVGSGGQDADEIYTGKLRRVYTKSHFLRHLSWDTGGTPQLALQADIPESPDGCGCLRSPGRIGLAKLLSELRRTSRRASAPFIDAYNLRPAFILETVEANRTKIEMMNPPASI
jgi:hypothetical protein